MAAAIPFAIQAGAAVYSHYKNKKPQQQQQAAMNAQAATGQQVAGAASPLLRAGQDLTGQGAGYLQQAGNYYGNILSNRRAASESLAPERATALDYYKGAEQKTNRTLRGGQRDYANAELERQKVGQLATMLPAARAGAAQGASQVGGALLGGGAQATGQGVNAAMGAGYLNSGLIQQGQVARQNQADEGNAWGRIASGMFDAFLNKGKKPALGPMNAAPRGTY